ncbi:MAG: UDP-N-acetylglucosamine enolpyruvyl transferase [Cruoricaptor ignavus]|nr:UDP-N-acetylglucosamine enolpyruvyl transferase [Cruoricaptor ignavus]
MSTETNVISGTAVINGTTVNVTATATNGDNNNIFTAGATATPQFNNLNGATGNQILKSSGGEVGSPNRITFTFDRPVVISEYSVTDVDAMSTSTSVNRIAWYEAFTLSGINFTGVNSGGMQSNATVSTSGVRFSTPLLSTPPASGDGLEWVRFTNSNSVSSFTHNFESIDLLYNFAQQTFSNAINFYALKLSLPCSPTNFLQTVTPIGATCPGNGSIGINYTNANIGSQFSYQILQGATVVRSYDTTPTSTNFNRTEQNLQAGSYTLRTRETRCDGTVREQNTTFTINNNFVPIAFDNVIECSINLRVNITQGTAVTFEIRSQSGTVIRPAQASNYFADLPAGTYNVAVTDACGNDSVKSVTISRGVYSFYVNENGRTGFNFLKDCNTIDHQIRIGFDNSYTIPADKFPIQVKYTITGPGGSPVTEINRTFTNNSSQFMAIDIPFYYGQAYTIKQELTDNCGQTHERSQTINRKLNFGVTQPAASCGQVFIGIQSIFSAATPITISFEQYPAGFDPANYNSDFAPGTYSATFTTNPTSGNVRYNIGSSTNPIPPGQYVIRVTDSCGHFEDRALTVNTMAPILRLQRQNPGCSDNESSIWVVVTNGNNLQKSGNITSIRITAAPSGFPYTLPYDVSSNIVNGELYMGNLPNGNYTFEAETTCGILTRSYNLLGKEKSTSYNVTYNCGSADITASLTARYAGTGFFIQRFNPEKNAWEHPITGTTYTEGTTITTTNAYQFASNSNTTGGALTTLTGTLNNIQSYGTFRLISQYIVFQNGSSAENVCRDILETFEVPKGGLALNNYYVIGCNNGNYTLFIDASGIAPLNYEIVTKDGNPFPIDNGTNPVFENLEPGLYTVKISDGCSNTISATVSVQQNKLPKIQPENICHGENGRLFISGLNYLDIRWYKDGIDTGVTGNSFPFTPYNRNIHTGLYEAYLTYPGNMASCIDTKISFNLTTDNENNPSAGIGQTVTLTQQEITQPINLFDYLSGTYDAHGYWTENQSTGLLTENIWNGQFAGSGTYEFTYTVDGTCSGTASSTVTIIIQGECYRDGIFDANVSNPSKHGITSLNRTVGGDDNWPIAIESAHTVLESKTKGFVINRLNTAQINAIAQPVNGMVVYDTDLHCIKIYVENTTNSLASRWICFSTPGCPSN